MKTKDRIIEISLQLFNQQGERTVSTNHIAAHLGISPGNLYYHFRNKQQIISHIFSQYEAYIDQIYTPILERSVFEQLQSYLDNAFQGIWRFRFLYANLPELLSRDPDLHERYLLAHHKVLLGLNHSLKAAVAQNVLRIQPEFLPTLAEGLKMVVTFWISHLYTQVGNQPITERGASQGVLQILALLHGYITPDYEAEFKQLIDKYQLDAA